MAFKYLSKGLHSGEKKYILAWGWLGGWRIWGKEIHTGTLYQIMLILAVKAQLWQVVKM